MFSEKRVLVCAKVIAMDVVARVLLYSFFFLLIIIIFTVVSAYCYEFIVLCGSYMIMRPSFKNKYKAFLVLQFEII